MSDNPKFHEPVIYNCPTHGRIIIPAPLGGWPVHENITLACWRCLNPRAGEIDERRAREMEHTALGRHERPTVIRDTLGSTDAAAYVDLVRTGSREQGLFYLIGLLREFGVAVEPDA